VSFVSCAKKTPLKRIVADLSLDKTMLQDVISKNGSADAPALGFALSS
jgi:hypothetical protein